MARKFIKFMLNDIREASVNAAREACVDIMNSLAEQGPIWTGAYSSAWYALAPGDSPGGARSTGRKYKYDLRNVPKQRFKKVGGYTITNGVDYAGQAQDLEPFDPDGYPESEPIKPERVKRGIRPVGGKRGELGPGSNNRSTAPLDWYLTYVNGGSLKKDLSNGASRGFGKFKGKGFG